MPTRHANANGEMTVTRDDLVALLNEDLAREYQAVISYVIYSQVLKGPQYMNPQGTICSAAHFRRMTS